MNSRPLKGCHSKLIKNHQSVGSRPPPPPPPPHSHSHHHHPQHVPHPQDHVLHRNQNRKRKSPRRRGSWTGHRGRRGTISWNEIDWQHLDLGRRKDPTRGSSKKNRIDWNPNRSGWRKSFKIWFKRRRLWRNYYSIETINWIDESTHPFPSLVPGLIMTFISS